MLKIIITLTAALVSLVAQAQVSESRESEAFTKIEVDGKIEVIFSQQKFNSVTVNAANPLSVKNVMTTITNGTLKISALKDMTGKVYVTSPVLERITAGNGSLVTVTNGIRVEELFIALASDAKFCGQVFSPTVRLLAKSNAVFNIRVESTYLYTTGVGLSKINLSGISQNAVLSTQENAQLIARNFIPNRLKVRARNQSAIAVYAPKEIRVSLFDTALVTFSGSPTKVILPENAIVSRGTIKNQMVVVADNSRVLKIH